MPILTFPGGRHGYIASQIHFQINPNLVPIPISKLGVPRTVTISHSFHLLFLNILKSRYNLSSNKYLKVVLFYTILINLKQ